MYACPRNLCFAGFDVFFLGRIALAGRFPWHGLIQSLAMLFLTWNTKLDFPLKWKRSCARSQTPGSLAHTGFPRRVSVASWEVVVLQTGKTNTSTIMIHHHPSSVRDAQKPIKRGPILWANWQWRKLEKTVSDIQVFILRCETRCLFYVSFWGVYQTSVSVSPGCRVSGKPLGIQSPDSTRSSRIPWKDGVLFPTNKNEHLPKTTGF